MGLKKSNTHAQMERVSFVHHCNYSNCQYADECTSQHNAILSNGKIINNVIWKYSQRNMFIGKRRVYGVLRIKTQITI